MAAAPARVRLRLLGSSGCIAGGAEPEPSLSLLPSASFTFSISNLSDVPAFVQPLQQAAVIVPGDGPHCAPVYLSFWSLHGNEIPAASKKGYSYVAHGYDVAKTAATVPPQPAPNPSSSCFDAHDVVANYWQSVRSPSPSSPSSSPTL